MEHTASRPRGESRSALSTASSRARMAPAPVPRRQPTPARRVLGHSHRASRSGRYQSTTTSAGSRSPSKTPAGLSPAMGHRDQRETVFPSSRAEETSTIFSGLHAASPCARAHWSTAKAPFTSVAVVMTAWPPMRAAISRARSLAPPRWPERMGMANCPPSSTTTTAGSVLLCRRWGAMDRTAMPAAPTKMRPWARPKAWAVQSAADFPASRVQAAWWPRRVSSSASRAARAVPRRVKAVSSSLIGTLPAPLSRPRCGTP